MAEEVSDGQTGCELPGARQDAQDLAKFFIARLSIGTLARASRTGAPNTERLKPARAASPETLGMGRLSTPGLEISQKKKEKVVPNQVIWFEVMGKDSD